MLSFSASLPGALPTLKMPPGPPEPPPMLRFMPLNMNTHMKIRRIGKTSHSRMLHQLSCDSMTTFTCSSAGSCSLSSPNISSALKLPETRKMKCGDFAGMFCPNLSAYFSILSGFIVTRPSNSFLMKTTSFMSPASHCSFTSAHSSFCGFAPP